MLTLDGATGGGQLVRTALALSARSGTAFEMRNVRGSRDSPGLKAQHLAAVRAVAAACDAEVSGASMGAERFTFRPGELRGGEIAVDVGTAGSVTLVFDALLPVADALPGPLRVTATGGTDVKWSPPFDYLRRVKLPLLARFGLSASVSLARSGYYPEGGGEATLTLEPSTLSPLRLTDRDGSPDVTVYSKAADALADAEVAERQADAAAAALDDAGLGPVERTVGYEDTACPGSAVVARAAYDRTLVGGDALGEPGRPAERVGREAAGALRSFHDGPAVVDRHMADQVVPFLAVAGGEVAVPAVTDHVETCVSLVESFGLAVTVEAGDPARVVG